MRGLIVGLVLGLSAPAAVGATHQMTVRELKDYCDNGKLDICRFFILGVGEGATLAKGIKTSDGTLCFRDNLTVSEIVDGVRGQIAMDLRIYPEDAQAPASGMIVAALMHAFPCKR